jgi:hypothetical protein
MARSFNGTTDGASDGTGNNLSPSTAISVSVWVLFSAFQNFSGVFGQTRFAIGGWGIGTWTSPNNTLAVMFNNQLQLPISGAPAMSTGTWYHAVSTYDQTAWKTYLNGTLLSNINEVANPWSPLVTNTGKNIGNLAGWGIMAGSVAECTVWSDITLTQLEVTALANGARPSMIRPKSLRFWYPLDGLQSPEPEISGAGFSTTGMTLTGTNPAFGPPIMQFTPRWPQFIAPPPVIPTRIAPPGFAWAEW